MKKMLIGLMAMLLSVSLAGCGSQGSAPANTETPKPAGTGKPAEGGASSGGTIKIGGVFSSSGGASPLGKPELDTVVMMAEKVNAAGGINGQKIELITYDDKSDQNEAVLAMKKLTEQDKVAAVIGGTTSGNTLAMIPLAEKSKIPFISVAASKQINHPTKPYVFKTALGDDVLIPRIIEYLKANGLTKVAWLGVDNPFGSSGKEEFDALAKDAGIEVAIAEVFEATVTDAKPMLTRVKKAEPQAIIVWGTAQESSVVVKNIRELGMEAPIFCSGGVASMQFIKLAGNASNGVMLPASHLIVADQLPDGHEQKTVLQDYAKDYQEKYNTPASPFGGHAWDAFQILIKAIEKAGNDSAKIRDSIESTTNFIATDGVYNMSAEDHNGLKLDDVAMVEIKDGKWALKK